ncbi:hypothetical protein NRS6110_03920 [Bacillus subtilis]|nr:hypothetical protein NRS6110_03920 [Bacillus subtilis]SEO02617.1 putative efflux protein, MATE family [Bacillus subtilis]
MKAYDFTQGNVLKQLVLFSMPIMLGNALQVSFQFIDSLWIGNLLGAKALGAAAVSSTVVLTVLSFILGLNNATLTILSQQKGKDDVKGMASYINAFVVLLTGLSIGFGAAGFFLSELLLRLLKTPESMIPLAETYLQIQFIGILFLFGYNFISTVLRALGDSKTPLRFIAFAVVLNTVLAPLFISVFRMGIAGAAYSTILSQGIAFFVWVVLCRQTQACAILNSENAQVGRVRADFETRDSGRSADDGDYRRYDGDYECC